MLLILSCLNCMCSESKDVNTEFGGDPSCKWSKPCFWAVSVGQRHCSVSIYTCRFTTDLGSASAGELTGCIPVSALNTCAFTHWHLVRICPLVCRAFGGDLFITVYCDVVKPHDNAEKLLLKRGQSLHFLHSCVTLGWIGGAGSSCHQRGLIRQIAHQVVGASWFALFRVLGDL